MGVGGWVGGWVGGNNDDDDSCSRNNKLECSAILETGRSGSEDGSEDGSEGRKEGQKQENN